MKLKITIEGTYGGKKLIVKEIEAKILDLPITKSIRYNMKVFDECAGESIPLDFKGVAIFIKESLVDYSNTTLTQSMQECPLWTTRLIIVIRKCMYADREGTPPELDKRIANITMGEVRQLLNQSNLHMFPNVGKRTISQLEEIFKLYNI